MFATMTARELHDSRPDITSNTRVVRLGSPDDVKFGFAMHVLSSSHDARSDRIRFQLTGRLTEANFDQPITMIVHVPADSTVGVEYEI